MADLPIPAVDKIANENHRPRFLVSWVEANGNPRGQTCMNREDVDRLVDHVISTGDYIIIEARVIGSRRRFHRNTGWKAPEIKQ